MPWPGDIESVTVTWMDGKQETYPCNTIREEDGVLKLSSVYKSTMITQVKKRVCVPVGQYPGLRRQPGVVMAAGLVSSPPGG